ncbi:hypothetical protein GFO_2114 [Christiangramia forsetii KT0803]|uniref:Uncharacterized protein n=1 Tax=Christiangramia forsetii (strain DSM 17595 / CGMCC 1.15422 / KT0803) TaxID=411154 RepID=A0M384_CHRFK|nr:hypothetical protein GFO_2114 [Christiangramia forsetii KT0803]
MLNRTSFLIFQNSSYVIPTSPIRLLDHKKKSRLDSQKNIIIENSLNGFLKYENPIESVEFYI